MCHAFPECVLSGSLHKPPHDHGQYLPLMGRLYGSAVPRALLFATLAALERVMLLGLGLKNITTCLMNRTIFFISGFLVGFTLVF